MITYIMLLDTEEEKHQFGILYECYRDALFYVANCILRDPVQAEDQVQETYVKLIKYLDHIKDEDYIVLKEYLKEKRKTPELKLSVFLAKKNKKSCHRVWSFIVTILKNNIYDKWREDNKYSSIPYDEYVTNGEVYNIDVQDMVTQDVENRYLIRGIQQLSYPFKEVLYLQYFYGYSSEQMGELLNKSPDNIRQISKRGREKLKKWMMKGGYSL